MGKKQLVRNDKGFTLIELMVAMVILAIIAAIAVPIYTGFKKDAITQEAYESLTTWGEAAVGRAARPGTYAAPTAPDATANFNYAVTAGATAASAVCTATATAVGVTAGLTAGDTLVLTVAGNATPPTKTFSGTLY